MVDFLLLPCVLSFHFQVIYKLKHHGKLSYWWLVPRSICVGRSWVTEEEFYTVLLLLGPMMLQVAALLLLAPGRWSSKFFWRRRKWRCDSFTRRTTAATTSLSNTTSSALLYVVPVGNSNTSSYLLTSPWILYTAPSIGKSLIMCWRTLLLSAMRECECQGLFPCTP